MSTYDPFEIVRPGRGALRKGPGSPPGCALVVDRPGVALQVLDGETAGPTRWDLFTGRVRGLYLVDTTEHAIDEQELFPCKGTGSFRARIHLMCRVEDPAAVVNRGIHNVRRVLMPLVAQTIRVACREFDPEDCAVAEEAALRAVMDKELLRRHDPAFRITQPTVALSLDDETSAFLRQLREDNRDDRLERQRLELTLDRLHLEAERDRQRAEHDHRRTAIELATEQLRIERYLELLAHERYGDLAAHLLSDSEAVDKVSSLINERRNADMERQFEALRIFLDADAVEEMDLEEPAKAILAQLVDTWSYVSPAGAGADGVADSDGRVPEQRTPANGDLEGEPDVERHA